MFPLRGGLQEGKKWVDEIEAKCDVVCEDWLNRYKEASNPIRSKRSTKDAQSTASLVELKLPTPSAFTAIPRVQIPSGTPNKNQQFAATFA